MVGGETEFCNDNVNSELCTSVESFKLDSALVSASNYLPDQTPDLAFDNDQDTNWGSGDFAPQWIQIDLMDEFNISGIELLVDQWPAGNTVHQVWGKQDNPASSYILLHEFSGNTSIGQTLNYTFPPGNKYRFIKVLTSESPSWVSWKEIKIFKGALSVKDENELQSFSLKQNFPNPFNPSTTFSFVISRLSFVTLKIYDLLGNEAATLVKGYKSAGGYEVDFDASGLSSGVYFYRIEAQTLDGEIFNSSRKMILVK